MFKMMPLYFECDALFYVVVVLLLFNIFSFLTQKSIHTFIAFKFKKCFGRSAGQKQKKIVLLPLYSKYEDTILIFVNL